MNIIKTKNFELALYAQGDLNSSKLAILLPGKLDTKDYAGMKSHVDFLSKKGFYAFSFDPPGTWESPGSINLYTMTNYLNAVHELIEYFGNKQTLLAGHSLGGAVAMKIGSENPSVLGFVAIMSRASFTKGIYRQPDEKWKKEGFKKSIRDIPTNRNETKEFFVPYHFLEDIVTHDFTPNIKTCIKPKLFIYGSKDTIGPPDLIREIYDMSAPPKEIKEVTSGHDYRLYPDIINKVNEYLEEFLTKFKIIDK